MYIFTYAFFLLLLIIIIITTGDSAVARILGHRREVRTHRLTHTLHRTLIFSPKLTEMPAWASSISTNVHIKTTFTHTHARPSRTRQGTRQPQLCSRTIPPCSTPWHHHDHDCSTSLPPAPPPPPTRYLRHQLPPLVPSGTRGSRVHFKAQWWTLRSALGM